jgi:arylsulfatase A-like enzyme
VTPNIVLILADDMGWGDPGCNNPESKVPTPHIDRIAGQGVRFANAHAPASVCTPSRYGLMTGRYAWRTHLKEGVFYGYSRHLIEPDRMTIASLLKDQGYATACIGKWHLGMDWALKEDDPGDLKEKTATRERSRRIGDQVDHTRPIENGPNSVGFDYFFGTAACSTCDSPYVFIENDRVTVEPVKMVKPGVSGRAVFMDPAWDNRVVDDVYVEKAILFMERHAASAGPFFLYLPLSAPHAPHRPPGRLEGASGDFARGDMCMWVDESVGKINSALERFGLADDTIFIFSSDNGGLVNGKRSGEANPLLRENPGMSVAELRRHPDWCSEHRVNGSWRGFKTDIWDGGSRIPFIARWPGHFPSASVSEEELCLTDLLASLAALTGTEIPRGAGEDSFNLLPAFLGERIDRPIRSNLITHSYQGVFSLRIENWKAVFDTEGSGGDRGVTPEWKSIIPGAPGQLYDLSIDPGETRNLWNNPDRRSLIARLTQRIEYYRTVGRSAEEPTVENE